MPPLVSVICLCYNHEKFVKQALESVLFQTYSDIQLIIVDDASQDKSLQIIEKFIKEIPHYGLEKVWQIELVVNPTNQGNCKAFNRGLQLAHGKYIIDLAADDVLLDERIVKQVEIFEKLSEDYAVVFSNATLIDEKGNILGYHHPVDTQGRVLSPIPTGNIYQAILEKYFICTASMMMRRSVLEELGGYDEELSYEDFDFWIRSSRKYSYYYLDEITTLKRVVKNAHSTKFYQKNKNPHLSSTLKVLYKAFSLNQNQVEHKALARQTLYYIRQAFFTQNFDLVFQYYELLEKIENATHPWYLPWILFLAKYKIKVHWLYQLYFRLVGYTKRFKIKP